MKSRQQFQNREAGQTIVLVAISIFSLLAMATLAIDVVSLYVARNEIQRAADAAALVGAKAIADSGVTTLQPGSSDAAAAIAMAQSMANSAITALISSPGFNQVAGGPVSLVGTPTITYQGGNNLTNNPTISVKLQRTGLPIFFARIIGGSASTASATAVAEAYNPANVQSFTPVAPRCVKPWLVANADPDVNTKPPFVDTNTWLVRDAAIGENFFLTADCNGTNGNGCVPHPGRNPQADFTNGTVEFLPALLNPGTSQMYASCAGASDYEQSIAGCDTTTYSYYQCGNTNTAAKTSWDPAIQPNPHHGDGNSATALATECLIHASAGGLNNGQDSLPGFTPWSNPPEILAGSGPKSGGPVATSNSVVTIPIVDTSVDITSPPYNVTILGYLQAFINKVDSGVGGRHDDINITVLNVVGCSNTPNANPAIIGGNGTSAIPVRLITPQ